MIVDKSLSEPVDLKSKLYQLVSEHKMSSLDMIGDMIGAEEEDVRSLLEELVSEGNLNGSFTDDGQRFFLSDVTVSSAPVADTKDTGFAIKEGDSRNGKLVLISGFVMLVAGYIVRGLISFGEMMEAIGSAVFMVGLVVLICGWLMISKANPPSNIK